MEGDVHGDDDISGDEFIAVGDAKVTEGTIVMAVGVALYCGVGGVGGL